MYIYFALLTISFILTTNIFKIQIPHQKFPFQFFIPTPPDPIFSNMKIKSICHKIISTPMKALLKARDLYVSGITSCANTQNFGSGAAVLGPMPESNMGRSFSVKSLNSDYDEDLRELIRAASTGTMANSTDEDLRELIRAASTGTLANRSDIKSLLPEQRIRSQPYKLPPRSSSVAMGRIDEDSPSLFGDLEKVNVKKDFSKAFPNSRSYAENKRRIVY